MVVLDEIAVIISVPREKAEELAERYGSVRERLREEIADFLRAAMRDAQIEVE
jgi:hypothetical protein